MTEFNIMLLGIVFAVALILVVVFRASRKASYQGKTDALKKLRKGGSYWGVTIMHGKCGAVRPLIGKGFRFDEAPRLPVVGCDARRCSCEYKGLVHRRKDHRRTRHDRREQVRFGTEKPERRSRKERRRDHSRWNH